jgi:hypothetical protein
VLFIQILAMRTKTLSLKWETGRKKRHTVGLCRPLGIRWLGGGCDWIEELCAQPAQEEVPGFPSLL